MTPAKLAVAKEMYASCEHTIAAIVAVVGVSRASVYRDYAVTASDAQEPPDEELSGR